MSFLRVILGMMIGFGSPFFLMAMETEKTSTVPKKRDYLSGQGVVIKFDDFDIETIDQEGRRILAQLMDALCNEDHTKTFVYEEPDLRIMKYHRHCLTQDEYNKVLELPITLRCKVGKLCKVTVVGEKVPHYSFSDKILPSLFLGSTVLFAGAMVIGAHLATEEGLSAEDARDFSILGGLAGAGLNILSTMTMEGDALERHGAKIELLRKPIITSEEQKMIEKEEQEAVFKEKQRAKEKEFAKFMSKTIKAENFEQLPQELSNRTQLDLLSLRNRL